MLELNLSTLFYTIGLEFRTVKWYGHLGEVIFVEMFRTTIGEDGFMVLRLTLRHKGVGIKQD